uniref:hypothetical protein n=1 Tax=Ornithobacterium rhinotracheale TaxID=28251 RepID=UPI00129C286D|nr:hypothetical protein [Ornithobacterium rhinotracheale]
MKVIKNLNGLVAGGYYKDAEGTYYKFNGVNGFGGAEALSFSLNDMEEKVMDLDTPWFDYVVKNSGVEQISEGAFMKAFKKFSKVKLAVLNFELATLEIARQELLED